MKLYPLKFILVFCGALTTNGFNCLAQASNIGTPPVSNFSKKDYKGSPQNWDIAQNEQGIMYFGNNEGLLEFDGVNWLSYKVSNQTIVRSVEIAEDGKIFIGAQGELGYFSGNENGVLRYQSLKHLLPKADQFFADIWNIEIIDNRVFFATGNSVFLYQNGKLNKIYTPEIALTYLTETGDEIFIHDTEKGLLKFNNETFSPILSPSFFTQQEISGIFSISPDSLIVSTIKNGVYLIANNQVVPWLINDNNVLKNSSIYCTARIDENTFAFGTSRQGVFIINKHGKVNSHIDRQVGLQVNNVLCLFTDRSNDLWAGLDNGIDLIETSSAFTNIFPDSDLKPMGYAIQIHDNQIYLGTANGVFSNEWKPYYNPTNTSAYQLVTNSDGQVWNLSVHKNDLILNHHEGIFVIEKQVANKIPSKNGAWLQLPVSENRFLSGHYDGLLLLEKKADWQIVADFQKDWQESCRFMVQDEQENIWVSHPYNGLFKLRFNPDYSVLEDVRMYNSKQGFPSDLQIYVFKVGDEPVFCAEQGIYTYNAEKDSFEPHEKWNDIFGENTRVRRLIEAPNEDVWFVTSEEVGVLEVMDGGIYKKVNKRTLPQLKDRLVNNFETIYPYNEQNVFFAHENGFVHYNPQKYKAPTNFSAIIRLVETTNHDSILFGGHYPAQSQMPVINFKDNALRFTFSATDFGSYENTQFQYYLEGYENKWLPWTEKSQKEYTNLNAGSYTFWVRARNIYGEVSPDTKYSFRILPPWYASRLAFIIYGLLISGMLFSFVFIPKKRFEREKAALQSEQEKTLQQKDQEHQQIEQKRQQQISQLEKEKLELKIQSKNQELASNTMHLVQKSEMLQKIKDDIQKLAKSVDDKSISTELKKIINKISADERLDNDWKQFANHFDQVHNDFLYRLGARYPQLTLKDHRLCAYLRMNLSSKEIASLMNISVRSVEVARYRLRKKLKIDSTINLGEFMIQV